MISTVCNEDNMRKYVAMLRHPSTKQTFNALRVKREYGERYCGLGVACKAAQTGGAPIQPMKDEEYGWIDTETRRMFNGYIPKPVSEWLGLVGYAGDIPVYADHDRLEVREVSFLNDHRKWNLHQIAMAVERTYLSDDYTARLNQVAAFNAARTKESAK